MESKQPIGVVADNYKIDEVNEEPPQTDSIPQTQNTSLKKQADPTSSATQTDWDKKIVKTAFLNAEVKNFKSFHTAIREEVKALGGYIAKEEQSESDYKIENNLVIKVPVEQFDNALTQLSDQTEKINERRITSEDVTTQIVDTRSRMEAKKQVRLRYLDLLKQAKNMEEILNVQSQINGIQEQIESAAGRLTYLGHSSTYSTINLTYYQVLNATAVDNSPSFVKQLASAFSIGLEWMSRLFIGLVSIWPFLLLLSVVFIVYKKTRPRKSKPAL